MQLLGTATAAGIGAEPRISALNTVIAAEMARR